MADPELLALLFGAALIAGCIDTLAGGGGLLSIPALLWAGLSPVEALATNKAQAIFGSGLATLRFARRGLLDRRGLALAVACTFAGALFGAWSIQRLAPLLPSGAIPLLLIAVAIYFWRLPPIPEQGTYPRLGALPFALTLALGVGFYDGLLGPGTGTFFALGYVALRGYGLRQATAHSKALNFTSNLAALLCFLPGGQIHWSLALLMAAGQLTGAWIGSHLVIRHGATLVRPALVAVSLLLSASWVWRGLG